ncbi:uncharacterized protein [Euwallacea similis]|uniref:uncharacterized protein n=1 Tax=Euwallacea similis TaxID=1736056 RepID=UPI00344F227E
MLDRRSKRAEECLGEIVECKDDLFETLQEIISMATLQVERISNAQISMFEKEGVLHFLRKVLLIISDLKYSALKYKENLKIPELRKKVSICSEPQNGHASIVQELQGYLKDNREITTTYDFASEGPKVPNHELNVSHVQKQLNNTTLKGKCMSIIEKNLEEVSHSQLEQTTAQSPHSAFYSDSDVHSTISSSTFIHPLSKFQPAAVIPEQYDDQTVEKVRENLRYYSQKMGFDSEYIVEGSNEFDKCRSIPNGVAVSYIEHISANKSNNGKTEELMNRILPGTGAVKKVPQKNSNLVMVEAAEKYLVDESSSSSKTDKLNNRRSVEQAADLLDVNGISTGVGVSKRASKESLCLENFHLVSTSESCEKVYSWLKGGSRLPETPSDSDSSDCMPQNQASVVEKLDKMKCIDRNEEAKMKALSEMPDLKLVQVPNKPKVMVNDLNSTSDCSGGASTGKSKEFNSEVVYSIKRMELPQVGAICVFSHIDSPEEFYLQIVTKMNCSYMDLITTTLKQKCSLSDQSFKSKQEAFAKIGKFCYGCLQEMKGGWFRLQVLDWMLDNSSDDVYVQAVDYGFKLSIPYTMLRKLTSDLAHIPMMSVKCLFPLLYPPGSTYANRLSEWLPATIELMYNIVNTSRQPTEMPHDIHTYELIFVHPKGSSLAVDMVRVSDPDGRTFGELMVDMGLAVQIIDEYEQNPELGEFLEDLNELEMAENLNEFILGYDARDEARICAFTRNDGTCPKKYCKLEHIPLRDGYTTDKTAVFCMAMNNLILPSNGQTVKVLVTSYIDVCTYLVQFVRDPVKAKPLTNMAMVMDREVSELMDAMNNPKIICKYKQFKVDPSVGEIILAFHPVAKQWLRVAVREHVNNGIEDVIHVYSVDFGDVFQINIKSTRKMREDFMNVPFQSVKIYLDSYQQRANCDDRKFRKFFDKHISYKNFLAHVKSNDQPFVVSLTTLNNKEIGPTLMKQGFAKKRKFDWCIAEDESKRKAIDLE